MLESCVQMSSLRPLIVTVVFGHGVMGGAEQWLIDMIENRPANVAVEAILLGESADLERWLDESGLRRRTIVTGPAIFNIARSTVLLVRELRRRRPDVLVFNGIKAAVVGSPAAAVLGIASIWCKHDYVFDRSAGRAVSRLVDAVVATSRELILDVSTKRKVVVPPPYPGIPSSPAIARDFWTSRGIDLSRPTVAMIGRLVHYKGYDIAIKALASSRDWQLVIVGAEDISEPGYLQTLQSLASGLGVSDRVLFAGRVEHVKTSLAAFDAVAVLTTNRPTSRYTYEGFGLTVLEAFAAGVPVLATADVPAVDLARDAAIIVDGDSPSAVVEALGSVRSLTANALSAAERLRSAYGSAPQCAAEFFSELSRVAARPGVETCTSRPLSVVSTVLNEILTIDALLTDVLNELNADDEFIVVDGGSRDGTREAILMRAAADPRLQLLDESASGISAGRNEGVRAARHNSIAFTDSGCRPADGWLDGLRSGLSHADHPSLVTGTYRATSSSRWGLAQAVAHYPDTDEVRRRTPLVRTYGRLFGTKFSAPMCTGRSMAVTREAWAEAGGFPEELRTAEDVTFGRAIVKSGGIALIAADAEVEWEQRSSVAATAKMFYNYGLGGAKSGDPLLVSRDIARGIAYLALPLMLIKRPGLTGLAALAYLSLPISRARRRRARLGVYPMLPFALALKDLAKAIGCAVGLGQRPPNHQTREQPVGSTSDGPNREKRKLSD